MLPMLMLTRERVLLRLPPAIDYATCHFAIDVMMSAAAFFYLRYFIILIFAASDFFISSPDADKMLFAMPVSAADAADDRDI